MVLFQGNDREFSKKAIESLIKKLKDKRDELDAFIISVSSMGQMDTKLVTGPDEGQFFQTLILFEFL